MRTSTDQNQSISPAKNNNRAKLIVIIFLAAAVVSVFVVKVYLISEKKRRKVERIICKTNILTIGRNLRLYIDDCSGNWPTEDTWCNMLLNREDLYRADFHCPGTVSGECHYALNKEALGLQFGEENKDMVFIFESKPGWNQVGGRELLSMENHKDFGRGCNVLFGDGSAKWISAKEIEALRWTPE